jgi:hypothetical protein
MTTKPPIYETFSDSIDNLDVTATGPEPLSISISVAGLSQPAMVFVNAATAIINTSRDTTIFGRDVKGILTVNETSGNSQIVTGAGESNLNLYQSTTTVSGGAGITSIAANTSNVLVISGAGETAIDGYKSNITEFANAGRSTLNVVSSNAVLVGSAKINAFESTVNMFDNNVDTNINGGAIINADGGYIQLVAASGNDTLQAYNGDAKIYVETTSKANTFNLGPSERADIEGFRPGIDNLNLFNSAGNVEEVTLSGKLPFTFNVGGASLTYVPDATRPGVGNLVYASNTFKFG